MSYNFFNEQFEILLYKRTISIQQQQSNLFRYRLNDVIVYRKRNYFYLRIFFRVQFSATRRTTLSLAKNLHLQVCLIVCVCVCGFFFCGCVRVKWDFAVISFCVGLH